MVKLKTLHVRDTRYKVGGNEHSKGGVCCQEKGEEGRGDTRGKPEFSQNVSRGREGRPAMGEGRRKTEVKAKDYTAMAITLR